VDEEENRPRETCPDPRRKPRCDHGSFRKLTEGVSILLLVPFLVVNRCRPHRYYIQGVFHPSDLFHLYDTSCPNLTTQCSETTGGAAPDIALTVLVWLGHERLAKGEAIKHSREHMPRSRCAAESTGRAGGTSGRASGSAESRGGVRAGDHSLSCGRGEPSGDDGHPAGSSSAATSGRQRSVQNGRKLTEPSLNGRR
jgi:hypothetical protein